MYNACAVLHDGELQAIYRKVYLPNYGVFDEQRYFQSGRSGAVIDIGEDRVGLTICEDIWEPGPPASDEALAGATLILNIAASPYHAGKGRERERMFAQRARDSVACFAYCGLVGGQDELVFDGHSCVFDHAGRTLARAAQFREELLVCDVDLRAAAAARLRDSSHRPLARRSAGQVAELARIRDTALVGAGARADAPSQVAVAPPPAVASDVTGDAPTERHQAPSRRPARQPSSPSCSRRSRPRCTARLRSACAITSARTASPTSCSASPAASTPRSSPASPPMRSAPPAWT